MIRTKAVACATLALGCVMVCGSGVGADDGVDTTTITDSASTNTVLIVTGLLLVAGVSMAALSVWFWRSTKPDPEALGPLLSMSRRGFASLDAIEQRRQLDQFRPGLAADVVAEVPELPEMLAPIETVDDVDVENVDAAQEIDDESDHVVESKSPDTSGEISWDDDEWPDLDDWSEIDSRSPRRDSDDGHEPLSDLDPEPRRRNGPIDPLLG